MNWKGSRVEKLCHSRVRITHLSCGEVTQKIITYSEAVKWGNGISPQGHWLRKKDSAARRFVKSIEHKGRCLAKNVTRLLGHDPEGDYDTRIPKRREDLWCYD